jgi:hypothetical protein
MDEPAARAAPLRRPFVLGRPASAIAKRSSAEQRCK